MFGHVAPTPYDLRFAIFGIPVRVHPVFWVLSAYLGWVKGRLDIVAVHMACIFLAILVHEMGHALVTRHFGWQPEIVLHMFGGYATSARHSTWKDIAVSAAGPAAGFLLVLLIWVPCRLLGLFLPGSTIIDPIFDAEVMSKWPAAIRYESQGNDLICAAIYCSLWFNFAVNLINLLPVVPLDGGQISREYWLWAKPRHGMDICLKLGIVTGGAIAAWGALSMTDRGAVWSIGRIFHLDGLFLGLMFGYLAYMSYEELQNSRGRPW
jgi:membrane-associated protease RseP (regulator of RpoE activity)